MKYTVFMRKARILLILGVWITILPYLGFPYSWKDTLSTLTGLVLIYFSYVLYKEYKAEEKSEETFDSFKENGAFTEPEMEVEIMEEEPVKLHSEEI